MDKQTPKTALVAAFAAVTGLPMKSMINMTRKDLEALWEFVVKMGEK